MKRNRRWLVPLLMLLLLPMFACDDGVPSVQSRSDMPIRGDLIVEYKITQPAGSQTVENRAVLRGTGDTGVPPFALLTTEFYAQAGLKSQNVAFGVDQALGMTKPERGLGWTRFAEYEPATQCTHDALGTAQCGTKVRIKFMQNAAQKAVGHDWDFDALLYYTIPATWEGGNNYNYNPLQDAELVSVTLNQVTQFRLGWGPSWFHNWGHSVVVVDGEPTKLEYGFWRQTEQLAGNYNDIHDAVAMLAAMVKDLGTSSLPWLEFSSTGGYSASTVIYSAGDADRYATADRLLLNRQKEYVVFYRPNRQIAWDWIRIVPSYNFEFNDFNQIWKSNVLEGIVDSEGQLLSNQGNNEIVREIEKIGCQNCPNPSLEQVTFYNSRGEVLYSITFRAYLGADDTLVIFGPEQPVSWNFEGAPPPPQTERPIDYTFNSQTNTWDKKPADQQTFATDEIWQNYLAEATVWEWLRATNPLDADLFLQFRVTDSSEWTAIPCSEGGICGYNAVRWNLQSNYYFDGAVQDPWLIVQLLGEVGMRTLGFSYVSGRYEGSGIEFALDQALFYQWYGQGFPNNEVNFMFDARALTTPAMLNLAWSTLQNQNDPSMTPGR